MGIEGLVDESAAKVIRSGYRGDADAALYSPGTVRERLVARSRSPLPTYEILMWNMNRTNPQSAWEEFEGHVCPKLRRRYACEGAAGCEPVYDEYGQPVALDYTAMLVRRQNLGNVRVDGVIGNLPPADVTRMDWRPHYQHAMKLQDPEVLCELMSRGVGLNPDHVPSMLDDLRARVAATKAGTIEAEQVQSHQRRAIRELEKWRDCFEQALELYEQRQHAPQRRIESITLDQIERVPVEERVAFLKSLGIDIAPAGLRDSGDMPVAPKPAKEAPVEAKEAPAKAAEEPPPTPPVDEDPRPVYEGWMDLKGCGKEPPEGLAIIVESLPEPAEADLKALGVSDVRAIAAAVGVDSDGTKAEIVKRLCIHLGA